MSDQPTGPDRNWLKGTFEAMTSFMSGKNKGKEFRRGKPSQIHKPTKWCPICADVYEKKLVSAQDNTNPETKNCPKCQAQLDAGMAAFVCGDRYAFGMSPKLTDMAGSIVQVSPHVMEALEKEFNVQTRPEPTRNPSNN